MAQAITFAQTRLPAIAMQDFARKVIVLSCAAALIFAGYPLPL